MPQIRGPEDLNGFCVICGLAMGPDDFDRQQAVLMTGPIENVMAHSYHIGEGNTKAKEYERAVRTMATEYVRRNKLGGENQ